MKDKRDKLTGNLLASDNAIRQARFAETQRELGRKARKIWPQTMRPRRCDCT